MNYGLIHTIVIKDCVLYPDVLYGEVFDAFDIRTFMHDLVDEIGMKVADIEEPYSVWIDHTSYDEDFKKGVSANLFIETSNISVHACDPQKTIRICIFTCKKHNIQDAVEFCEGFWSGECVQSDVTEVL